ncbi:MAG: DMT family transporter [Lachnospiraceae bacterium]
MSTQQHNNRAQYTMGILFIIASAFCFALMNLFIRLTGDVPTMQKCFFRNFFALLIAVGTLVKTKTPFKIGKGNTKYLLIRSLAGGLGMVCNFYAVDHMAISDASMLNKLSPFFAIVFSIFVLQESVRWYEWLAVFCAFGGALFVVKPSFSFEVIPALAGTLGGFGAGLAYAYVRKLGMRGEKSMIVVAFFSGFTTLMLTPNLILNYAPMTGKQWFFLCLTGITAAGGQICITNAYAKAPAKEISVYDFSIVIFAAILGYLFLNQKPDLLSVVGYVIIIGTAVVKWYLTVIRPKKNENLKKVE